jgi:hypothetical protein
MKDKKNNQRWHPIDRERRERHTTELKEKQKEARYRKKDRLDRVQRRWI